MSNSRQSQPLSSSSSSSPRARRLCLYSQPVTLKREAEERFTTFVPVVVYSPDMVAEAAKLKVTLTDLQRAVQTAKTVVDAHMNAQADLLHINIQQRAAFKLLKDLSKNAAAAAAAAACAAGGGGGAVSSVTTSLVTQPAPAPQPHTLLSPLPPPLVQTPPTTAAPTGIPATVTFAPVIPALLNPVPIKISVLTPKAVKPAFASSAAAAAFATLTASVPLPVGSTPLKIFDREPVDSLPPLEKEVRQGTKRPRLPKATAAHLKQWLLENNPFPSEEDKKVLAAQLGLSVSQVYNWFATARHKIITLVSDHEFNTEAHFGIILLLLLLLLLQSVSIIPFFLSLFSFFLFLSFSFLQHTQTRRSQRTSSSICNQR